MDSIHAGGDNPSGERVRHGLGRTTSARFASDGMKSNRVAAASLALVPFTALGLALRNPSAVEVAVTTGNRP